MPKINKDETLRKFINRVIKYGADTVVKGESSLTEAQLEQDLQSIVAEISKEQNK